jgi:hypothetical protein
MKVAIVVPAYRADLSPEEEISLKHLLHFLGRYDKYLVIPKSSRISHPGFTVKRFHDGFFKSTETYSALLLQEEFYKTFREYEYILIYQLDALVFSDQLLEWCDRGFDYIGAPWFHCEDTPHVKAPRVGNGGFSLRKVESFLRVLQSPKFRRRYWTDYKYWKVFCTGKPAYVRYLNYPKRYLKKRLDTLGSSGSTIAAPLKYPDSMIEDVFRMCIVEDVFYSYLAEKFYPEFNVASVEEGLRFAFEYIPRACFELNNRTLPFGCHAWFTLDREFWAPYLLPNVRGVRTSKLES